MSPHPTLRAGGPRWAFGHNRDQKRGKMQIVWVVLTNEEGCPVAVGVFSGDTRDPQAITAQVDRLRAEFGSRRSSWSLTGV